MDEKRKSHYTSQKNKKLLYLDFVELGKTIAIIGQRELIHLISQNKSL